MLIQNNTEVKDIGFESNSQMSIKAENLSKIYKLLTTSSYKDNCGSITREYCANAVDSHISSRKIDEPVYFKYDGGQISITDNGLGMSDEFIRDVYMSLGESTKEESADLIGGFGIGAKSLFSYTTYYYLNSRYNGVMNKYLISENESGLPDVLLLESVETTECNGVQIVFELKESQDFDKFKYAAENQLKYFKNIIIEGFGISNDYKLIQGEHFIYRPDRNNTTGKLEVVWSNVCYPIDYKFLGIEPLNVNCALYFPQETPFLPEAARENLRNVESNKKLILDKIELFKEEITNLWKDQQIVDNFFEWCEKSKKEIIFENGKLDVSGVVKEDYIYAPLLNTSINPSTLKYNKDAIFTQLFVYRKNSRFWSGAWDRIGYNKLIFHANGNVSNHRLAKIGWQGAVTQREVISLNWRTINNYYKKEVVTYEKVNYEIVDPGFDYIAEIEYLRDEIWKNIVEKTIDAHSIEISKTQSVRRKYTQEDIRGKFSDVDSNQWRVRKMVDLKKYKYIVYTTNEEEYKWLRSLNLQFVDKKTKKYVTDVFLAILTNSKYEERVSHFMTYEKFLNSDLLKKCFYKLYKQNNKVSTTSLENWKNIHAMYRRKFKHFDSGEKYSGYFYIPNEIMGKLKEKHSTEFIDKQNERLREEMKKYQTSSSSEVLKYRLLYQFNKNKLNKLLEKCN